MVKIDIKDRKILYQLDSNCRQSNTQIGKKVGLKKDVVSYRIKKLQDEGVIRNFWTAINTFKLGYNVFRVYIKFQYVSPSTKNEIIEHFTNYKNVWAVTSSQGPIDLVFIVWVNNIYEFYRFWSDTLEKYEEYMANYTISIYIQAVGYKKSYLLEVKSDNSERKMYAATCDGTTSTIDDVDYKLLNEIAINARIPLIDLADKLDCSSQSVNYRIKQLMEKDIIQAFRVNIDLVKLGLQILKIDIHLKDYKQRSQIIQYLENKPYLECLNVAVGWSDIEPELVVENVEKLAEIMDELDTKFPGSIKKHEYWIMIQGHKERWLPEF